MAKYDIRGVIGCARQPVPHRGDARPAACWYGEIADDRGCGEGGRLPRRPQDIVETLKAVEQRSPGLDRVICASPLGTPLNVQLEDLDRFAKEVIRPSATPEPPPRRNRP